MDRNILGDEREPEITGHEVPGDSRSRQQQLREERDTHRGRPKVEWPEREYHLSDTQLQTMAEIGRFRTLSIEDLAHYRYQGNIANMRRDCRQLLSQGLTQTKSLWLGRTKDPLAVVTLTWQGKKVLEQKQRAGDFLRGIR